MLEAVNTQLRRHRRKVLWALALLAVVGIALTARTVLMDTHGHGQMDDAIAICISVGVCVAIAGVSVFALRRPARRPLWLIPSPLAPALAMVATPPGFLARAGPPPLLQVFRL